MSQQQLAYVQAQGRSKRHRQAEAGATMLFTQTQQRLLLVLGELLMPFFLY